MALALTSLGGAAAGSPTSFSTSSLSLDADDLLLLQLVLIQEGPTTPTITGVTGTGLTLASVVSRSFTDGASFSGRQAWYRAQPGSSFADVLSITATDADYANWKAWKVAGAVVGNNGADAIIQAVGAGGTGTTPSVTLSAFADAANMTIVGVGRAGGATISAEGGHTAIGSQVNSAGTSYSQHAAYTLNDTSATMTLSASNTWSAIAVEIAEAEEGGGGFQAAWARYSNVVLMPGATP